VVDDFHAVHEQTYGHSLENRRVEIVNMRLQAVGKVTKPELMPEKPGDVDARGAYLGDKKSPFGGTMALYDRAELYPGMRLSGEALIFQLDSTVYVAPGWSGRVDGYRNLILERL
jgi:N-methylhydantoinase A